MRRRLSILLLALVLTGPSAAVSAHEATVVGEDPALRAIAQRVASGVISPQQGRLLSLQRALEPELLPDELRELVHAPLRCATPVVREALDHLESSDPATREAIEALLAPKALRKASTHLSGAGLFALDFETDGTDAIPLDDVDPANGIPDFVERVASYLDESWQRQVDELGFVAPATAGAPYEVSFESMGSYGYTTISGTSPGGTRIVMNNDFLGFPSNEDPEGDVIGAAKVTAAHELKHAIQYATSAWSESGLWPELDATWVEDIVYDAVNDYYNYMPAGSPIVAPASSLDLSGGGSYPDAVFQHWISETWGIGAIVQLWERRAAVPAETMVESYEWMLQQQGSSFDEGWVDFASWNYACGSRARSGFGYEESSGYPTSTVAAVHDTLPADHSSVVNRLAAEFTEYTGFTPESGSISLRVQRSVDSTIDLVAVVGRRDGSWAVHPLALTEPDETVVLPEDLADVEQLAVIAANGSITGSTQAYSLTVEEAIAIPAPSPWLDVGSVSYAVVAGNSGVRNLNLRNIGEAGSILGFRATPMAEIPLRMQVDKSISGSLVSLAAGSYEPGTTVDLFFSVTNGSSDFEWLQEVEIDFPPGIHVLSSTDLVGGSGGELVSNGSAGDGATVLWVDGNGSWGNVKGGETATAYVTVEYDPDLFGELSLDWTIRGDGYGGDPHQVSGVLGLLGPSAPPIQLLAPVGQERWRVGQLVDVQWSVEGNSDVRLELSRDGGATWKELVASTANDGIWTWSVTGPATTTALIRVSTLDRGVQAQSEQSFWIYDGLDWITVDPAIGTIGDGEEVQLALHFDSTGLSVGDHAGVLLIDHDGSGPPLQLPIVLTVAADATDNTPGVEKTVLRGNQPNPFNPATKIHFSMANTGRARLDVYDTRGKHLRTLADREFGAGEHYVSWNSRDQHGEQVASGTYLYVLRAAGATFRGKMTLVK